MWWSIIGTCKLCRWRRGCKFGNVSKRKSLCLLFTFWAFEWSVLPSPNLLGGYLFLISLGLIFPEFSNFVSFSLNIFHSDQIICLPHFQPSTFLNLHNFPTSVIFQPSRFSKPRGYSTSFICQLFHYLWFPALSCFDFSNLDDSRWNFSHFHIPYCRNHFF